MTDGNDQHHQSPALKLANDPVVPHPISPEAEFARAQRLAEFAWIRGFRNPPVHASNEWFPEKVGESLGGALPVVRLLQLLPDSFAGSASLPQWKLGSQITCGNWLNSWPSRTQVLFLRNPHVMECGACNGSGDCQNEFHDHDPLWEMINDAVQCPACGESPAVRGNCSVCGGTGIQND